MILTLLHARCEDTVRKGRIVPVGGEPSAAGRCDSSGRVRVLELSSASSSVASERNRWSQLTTEASPAYQRRGRRQGNSHLAFSSLALQSLVLSVGAECCWQSVSKVYSYSPANALLRAVVEIPSPRRRAIFRQYQRALCSFDPSLGVDVY